jgi:hypothetical protein
MATTKKKAAKKAATKAAKKPAPNGAAELKAFGAAIRNLKTTGFALAKVAKINKHLRTKSGVRGAVHSALRTAAMIAKGIPAGPPGTTIQQL